MAAAEIELRVAALESEVARLKQQISEPLKASAHWVDEVYGAFADDPDFLEAMRLGRSYRESLRPRPAKRPAKLAAKKTSSAPKRAVKGVNKAKNRTASRTAKARKR
jgi:hypothetical protein